MSFAAGLKSAYKTATYHISRYNAAWTTASKAAAAAAAASASGSAFRTSAMRDGRRSAVDYARAFHSKKQSARDAIRSRLRPQPSILDFSLRYQFMKSPRFSSNQGPWAWGEVKKYGRLHPKQLPLEKKGKRYKLRMLLLEAYTGRSLRHTPQSCPAHGRERTTPFCGGNSRYRVDFDHARWRACRAHYRRAHYHHHRRRGFRLRRGPCPLELATWFIDRQLDRGCRKIQHLNKLAPTASLQPHATANSSNNISSSHDYGTHSSYGGSSGPSGFLRPRAFQPRHGTALLASPPWSVSHSFGNVYPAFNLGAARLFSTSSCKRGPGVLLKAAYLLKSSNALSWINLLFRMSVSFIPLSIKRASWARKARLAQLATGAVVATPYWASVFKIICRGAIALPFVLLLAVLVVAIERTPITGRLRLLLLNQEEEQDIVNKVLEVGAIDGDAVYGSDASMNDATRRRDWLTIMRTVLGEEHAPEGTLLGGDVLSPADWRTQVVQAILAKLEHGIPAFNTTNGVSSLDIEPPPLVYPLCDSPRCTHLHSGNAVLVIDRPESNAFSFGFYGSVDQPQPGVIIVFTGAIDEIMANGISHREEKISAQKARTEYIPHESIQESSWIRSFFGSHLAPPVAKQSVQSKLATSPMTPEQEEALAVLVAHELAHLVLSHTLESYANTALLWPQLEKLGWDMLRVFIYPVTAVLGPFVQDAISATVKVGIEESAEGRGLLPALTSSCESKKLEYEADAVALRLLANAGIDPRSAIQFWEDRLLHQSHAHGNYDYRNQKTINRQSGHLRDELRGMHDVRCENDAETHSFIKTHPADQDRILAIKRELAKWRPVSHALAMA